jgi:four helix bundle protein
MAKVNFENLRIYQLAEQLADHVWSSVATWDSFAKDTVGKQLVRAADSIGANIAEGSGRGSSQDYRRFLRISRGSLYETLHWLRRAYMRRLLSAKQTKQIREIISELSPTLNAYLRSVSKSAARKTMDS